jgi:hypothetical protein
MIRRTSRIAPIAPMAIPALAPAERPFLDATIAGVTEDDGGDVAEVVIAEVVELLVLVELADWREVLMDEVVEIETAVEVVDT